MGGLGSGLWSDLSKRKTSVEQCLVLSLKSLRQSGFLAAGRVAVISWTNAAGEVIGKAGLEMQGRDDIGLRMKVSGCGQDYYIDLIRTPCRFGGWRYWFTCPLSVDGVFCGNRCSKLYLPPTGQFFGCRHCYDLTYLSVQENHKHDRALGYIEKVDLDSLSVTQAMRLSALKNV